MLMMPNLTNSPFATPPLGTLRVLPTELALEAMPEFDAISRRMLSQWVKDKLLVSRTLCEQFDMPLPNETLVDEVHQRWLQANLKHQTHSDN